jgi:transcriptional regulator with XRE-family HTH domain
MNPQRLGRTVRALRLRQRLTQAAVALRAGVGRSAVSLVERGRARELSIGVVEAIIGALGGRIDLRVFWNGPDLDRLLDAGHAWIGASIKRRLERWGWVVQVEVSYSRYGERGRIDLLAWHPVTGSLLVIEVKTAMVDVQQLLGDLDAKARLARHEAARFGWRVNGVVPAIVLAEDRTTRRRLSEMDALFDRYALRGRACISWLRTPSQAPNAPSGALWFVRVPSTVAFATGQQRVRQRRAA